MRSNLWWIAVPALLTLIVFPLQTIIGGLLVATLFVVAGAYALWMMRHPTSSDRVRSLDRIVHYGLIGALGVGVVLIALWPITAAIAVFTLAVVASTAWIALDYSVRHPARVLAPAGPAAASPASTDEPEFWAEALLQPTPEPTPPEPVPTDPTPRVLATARRRPARTRRLGPQAPRAGTPTRVRSRSRSRSRV